MKPTICTIFIWLLTLSLAGLPVIVQSQGIIDLKPTDTEQVDTNMSMRAPELQTSAALVADGQVSEMHCHSSSATQADDEMATSSHDCCCGSDCQCDAACQSVQYSVTSALLQTSLFSSFHISSQLVIESATSYRNRDSDVEKSPPIV